MSAEAIEQVLPEPTPLALVELQTVDEKPLKLDLGCGQMKAEGFVGIDKYPAAGVDEIVDLFSFPWPWADDSVMEVRCSNFFEHIPKELRVRFMEELWRVLKPGHGALIITPHWQHERAYGDFTHEWPPITPWTYLYFDKNWREREKLTHGAYAIKCDFAISFPFEQIEPQWSVKSQEARGYAQRHYNNVSTELIAQVVKR